MSSEKSNKQRRGTSPLQRATIEQGGEAHEKRMTAVHGGTAETWAIHEHTCKFLRAYHAGELEETIHAASNAGVPIDTEEGQMILKAGAMGGQLVKMFIKAVATGDSDLIHTIANAVKPAHARGTGEGKTYKIEHAKPGLFEIVEAANNPEREGLAQQAFYDALSDETRKEYLDAQSVHRIRKKVTQ